MLERLSRPGAGVRLSTRYSMPSLWQYSFHLLLEVKGQVAGNKSAGSRNEDEIVFLNLRIFFHRACLFHWYIFLWPVLFVDRRERQLICCRKVLCFSGDLGISIIDDCISMVDFL